MTLARRRTFMLGLLALCACLFVAPGAWSAPQEPQPAKTTGAPPPAEQAPEDSSSGQIFRWLNFILVFGGIGYFIAKSAPAFFRARAAVVAKDITEAAAQKSEAEARLRQAEAGLAQLAEAQAKMRADSQRDFAAEAERIRQATAADIEKVDRTAEVEIEAASRMATIELRTAAAKRAVERAAALVSQQMTPERRELIFRKFVGNLPRGAN